MRSSRTTGVLLVALAVLVGLSAPAQPAPAVPSGGQSAALKVPRMILDGIRYRSIGPTKQGGRIMDFGVPDQSKQPDTFYAAASTGGLWKTADAGLTWQPIFDDVPINAIGDVAVAPSDPDVLYVGTGNASYWGEGIYRSPDGGKTWEHRGLDDSLYISRIRVHPRDADTLWVAAAGSHRPDSLEKGIFRSHDGGATWTRALAIEEDGHQVGAADVVIDPRDPDVLYASTWDRHGGDGSGIYKSTDGGDEWTRLEGGLPTGRMDRIGLDIFHSNADVIVASILLPYPDADGRDSYSSNYNTVWRSDDAGATWRLLSPDRSDYNLKGASRFGQIRIDPNDDDRIYVLNTGVQGTPDGGATWQKMIHFAGDNQAMWINPANSSHILLGYDYGLAISHSRGETWFHPDNLPLGQLEGVGVDMARPYNVYGGMQDFGTWRGPSTKRGRWPIRFEDWEHVGNADGSYAQIDPRDNRWLYVESQNGSISRNDQRTGVRSDIRYQRDGIRFNFIAPILLSAHNPDVLYHAANVVLRSPHRGEGWEEISPDLSQRGTEFDDSGRDVNGTISTIDESPIAAAILWAGTDNGNVWVTRNQGAEWSLVSDAMPDWPAAKVTRVEASHHAAGRAYVSASVGRRDRRDLRPYLLRTDDYGASWRSIVANLPEDEPINVIREDHNNPDLLFVGTAKGVYVSLDGGTSWTSLRNNMPNIPIHDLAIHPRDNDLIVGTYGRSFWIADIAPLQELDRAVLQRDVHLFDIAPQVLWIAARQTQVASIYQNYAGENAPKGAVIHYTLRGPAADGVTIQVYRGSHLVNEFTGPGEVGLNTAQWYLTERVRRSAEEVEDWTDWDRGVRTEEEYFDYYDGTDHFGPADSEVSVFGRPLAVWVHTLPEWRERDYKHIRATPGQYTVKLTAGGVELSRQVMVLQDEWFDRTY